MNSLCPLHVNVGLNAFYIDIPGIKIIMITIGILVSCNKKN